MPAAASSTSIVYEVCRYKKLLDASFSDSEGLEVLRLLDSLVVDRTLLARTKIGLTVAKHKQHPNPELAQKAKKLLDKWRSAVTSRNPSGQTAAAAATATAATAAAATEAPEGTEGNNVSRSAASLAELAEDCCRNGSSSSSKGSSNSDSSHASSEPQTFDAIYDHQSPTNSNAVSAAATSPVSLLESSSTLSAAASTEAKQSNEEPCCVSASPAAAVPAGEAAIQSLGCSDSNAKNSGEDDLNMYSLLNCKDPRRNKAREILFRSFIEGVPSEQLAVINRESAAWLVGSIEDALWDFHMSHKNGFKEYQSQLRSIKSNFADRKNPEFNIRVYVGAISAEKVARMPSTEMASDAKKAERLKAKKDALEACQSDWDLRNVKRAEGQFPCGKCKSLKTTYFQMQTRSSDEPMTTFVSCLNCGNRWKF